MQVIKIFYSPEEADAVAAYLVAHGQDARILDRNTLSVLPLDSVALGGYRLAVPAHQEERSRSLLASLPSDNGEPTEKFGQEEVSLAVERTAKSRVRMIIIGIFLAILAATLLIQSQIFEFESAPIGWFG